jgi:outer membrane lipopolysaccharide assembly protein LptE/RlpB
VNGSDDERPLADPERNEKMQNGKMTIGPPQPTDNNQPPPRRRFVLWGLALAVAASLTGCAFYGFSGASIPSHLETIAIPIAEDNTASPIPTLGRDLTGLLTDRFVDRTRLSLNNNETNADAVLTARILRYTNQPTGVSGDERATTNDVELRVQVRYYDQVEDSTMVEKAFTGSAEYNPSQTGTDGERQAARLALERVADDIFTTATSNW